ncbi:MAG: hypothetical protein WCC66_08975 [Rhizobiaceae bacterium]
MSEDVSIGRRQLLALLCGAAIFVAFPETALAKDGGDSGGDSGSGSSGSGSGSNSGSGSDNSGSGSDDSDDDDDDDGSSNSGSGSGKDQDKARDAVQSGKVIPLSNAISLLRKKYSGRIIQVRLTEKGSRIDYRFKVVDGNGKVVSVSMDAQTGHFRGFLGF